MNRRLSYINLAGVMVLVVLCVSQWHRDRQLNLALNQSETRRFQQQSTLLTLTNQLQGMAADLADFKRNLADENARLTVSESKSKGLSFTNEQLAAECDQLKQSIVAWSTAVGLRDQQITNANGRIKSLATDLNAAVDKYNALVTNYNAVVLTLNSSATNQPAGSGGK